LVDPTRSSRASNHRASIALLLGLGAVLAIPAAIALAQQSPRVRLIAAAWGIPVAIGLAVLTFAFTNLARARIHKTVGRAGGEGRARWARRLAVLGLCIAVTAMIAVGFYELLLRFE
jgi:uncharacterized membrane protein